MGEEKKEEEKKEEKKEEEKKEEEPPEIVLKVDMHCEACARKVARALKGFEGVEEVATDSKASKVVVKGKAADPLKVCERLQKKSGRKVELISPLPKPPEEAKEEAKDPPKEEEKKDEVKISKILRLFTHNHYHSSFTYHIFTATSKTSLTKARAENPILTTLARLLLGRPWIQDL